MNLFPTSVESLPTTIPSVSELTAQIKEAIEGRLAARVWVAGEISNANAHSSGHFYFTLKDARAQLKAVMWRSGFARLKFRPTDGTAVIASGQVSVYAPQGVYQISVDRLEPQGAGALDLAFRQLREKLEREGLFAKERKRPLPKYPRRIALVTSPTGAAIRDMLQILGRRWPAAEVWVVAVPVQGAGAAAEIARRLRSLNGVAGIDVVIVGRGGGSLEDLWAFNEEVVARALADSQIPTISAVGHETDVTIADMVADLRAATPSEAAERVVPNRVEVEADLENLWGRIGRASNAIRSLARTRLDRSITSRAIGEPLAAVRVREQRCDDLHHRLNQQSPRLQLRRSALRTTELGDRLGQSIDARSRVWGRAAEEMGDRLAVQAPWSAIRQGQARVAECARRLCAAARAIGRLRSAQLAERESRHAALGPLHVLARGYSLTLREDGSVLRDATDVRPGAGIVIRLARGAVAARVLRIIPPEDPSFPLPSP